jgi:hypothetical protein
MEVGVLTIGVSGYLCLLCAACGLFLLTIDVAMTDRGSKDYRTAKAFGWIHLVLAAACLLLLWLL